MKTLIKLVICIFCVFILIAVGYSGIVYDLDNKQAPIEENENIVCGGLN